MARNRRDRGDNPDNILGELGSNESSDSTFAGLTASDIADVGYNSGIGHDDPLAKLGREREKIRQTLIDSISPNPSQPRRAIPFSVRHYWSGSSDFDSMATLFTHWLEEINLERQDMGIQEIFPLDDFLQGNQTNRTIGIDKEDELDQISDKRIGSKEQSLMLVVELASSIKRDGLINPVSIAKKGVLWEIETGERRWLAYHLLNWRIGGTDWQKIPARQVDSVNIWRQATENNARADLNAIAKARQFALLLMDVRAEKEGNSFAEFPDFEHEQEYYAQVSDGKKYNVPYGMGEQLINAMGIRDVGQLRHLRRLLRLPNIVWTVADDLNWTENFIQKNILNTDNTQTIINGVAQAIKQGYPAYLLEDFAHLLEQEKVPKPSKPKLKFADIQKSTLAKLETQLSKLNKSDRTQAIDYLEHLLNNLKNS